MTNEPFKMDKVFSISRLGEDDEKAYWARKSPEERLEALETMRQIAYGYDPVTTRLQRFFEIVEPT
jgi:hypothetical protein